VLYFRISRQMLDSAWRYGSELSDVHLCESTMTRLRFATKVKGSVVQGGNECEYHSTVLWWCGTGVANAATLVKAFKFTWFQLTPKFAKLPCFRNLEVLCSDVGPKTGCIHSFSCSSSVSQHISWQYPHISNLAWLFPYTSLPVSHFSCHLIIYHC